MAYDGTIELSEDKVKEIIRKHLKSEGYDVSDSDNAVTVNIRAGHDGGRFGSSTRPSLRNIKVKIKV